MPAESRSFILLLLKAILLDEKELMCLIAFGVKAQLEEAEC